MIDHAALALGSPGQEHFLDDVGQAFRLGLHRAGQRVAAQGAETHFLLLDARLFLVGEVLEDAFVIDHDQRAVLLDHFALGSEVQRHDWDLLQVDVLPDVQLGPVRQREDADRLALLDLAVVHVPQLGALVLRVPTVLAVAEGIHALLGARLLFVAARATEGGIEAVLVQRLLETFGLHHVGVLGTAVGEGVHVLCHTVGVDVGQQIQAVFTDHLFAKAVHLLEFPARIDV